MPEADSAGSQASFLRFDPPYVDDPAEVLPGGWHHFVVFGYDHVAGFLAVDPADCEACRDRVYRRHGCVNGHLRRDMTDRALTSPPEVFGDA